MKNIVFLLIIFLGSTAQSFSSSYDKPFKTKTEMDLFIASTLKDMAGQMNSQMPMMMDPETRADAVFSTGKVLNYRATLVNIPSTEIDAAELNRHVLNNVNEIACKDKATRDLIDLGVTYVYLYFGNDDRFITKVVLDKYKCNF